MPRSIPKAAKAKEAAIMKEEALQRAVEEFHQMQGLPGALSQGLLANKHGIARSTLQAHINGPTVSKKTGSHLGKIFLGGRLHLREQR